MLIEIQNKLSKISDTRFAESGKNFFKEPVNLRGIRSADIKKLARAYFTQIDKMEKSAVFSLCEDLMQSVWYEDFMVACEFSYHMRKSFEKSDFRVFEKWVKNYIHNWAACDTFCNHTMGEMIEKFPELISEIKNWTLSENLWVRRAAAVSFIVPARHNKFTDDIFEIAEVLLTDEQDMVQKGYGWALKVVGETDPKCVYDFVTSRADKMPRTAYRYAIEKLPADMKQKAMSL
ncbi:MAG: DNA alkylation repair protein [Alphaproteobacteria bacterium]|nr:DNA alkylation repair protein [Alphaproteobacteria bacterium]